MKSKYLFLSLILFLCSQSQNINASDEISSPKIGFSDIHIQNISKDPNSEGLDKKVLDLALRNYKNLIDNGLTESTILTVVDFSKESGDKRLWVIDLEIDKIIFHELVSHGLNSGDNKYATRFSNKHGSKQSSLGVFLTGHTYLGKRGFSLKLHGLEKGINDNAYTRGVVMHAASYVNESRAKHLGHVGQSHGCFSVRKEITRPLINTLKGGSVLYAHHDSRFA